MQQPDPLTVTEVTLGEVYRLQVAQNKTLEGIGAGLQQRPTWDDVNRLEAARVAREVLQNQAIKELEDGNRWLVRTVGAALITALGAAAGVVMNLARIQG